MTDARAADRRVLVIEDEADIRDLVSYNLQSGGYQVETADTGQRGLAVLETFVPDVVLLDLMLPDISGTEVCRRIRARTDGAQPAIIMLTAKGEEIDRVVGFELGADDYVVKPFSVRELLLRLQAVLRRGAGERSEATDGRVDFGCLSFDRNAHRVWVEGSEIDLTALEFKLLVTLFDRRDRVQSRAALLDDVWGITADITTRTVDTHVKRLREKLAAARDSNLS